MNNLLLFIMAPLVVFMHGSCAQESFDQALQQYEQHEFGQALTSFQQIPQKTSAVWYNMGNCAYRLHDYPAAYALWQKAAGTAMGRAYDDCLFNCARVQDTVSLDHDSFFISKMIARWPTILLQLLFLFFWYVFLWFILRRCTVRASALICLCFFTGAAAACVMIKYRQQTVQHALVRASAECLAGPDCAYQALNVLNPGHRVIVLDERNEWIKVAHDQGKGWVKKEIVLLL